MQRFGGVEDRLTPCGIRTSLDLPHPLHPPHHLTLQTPGNLKGGGKAVRREETATAGAGGEGGRVYPVPVPGSTG